MSSILRKAGVSTMLIGAVAVTALAFGATTATAAPSTNICYVGAPVMTHGVCQHKTAL
jgi:hypothetical protein